MATTIKGNQKAAIFVGILAALLFFIPATLTTTGTGELAVAPSVAHATIDVGTALGTAILSAGASFTWLGGIMFQGVFHELVIGMGTLIVKNSTLGIVINDIWGVVRDAANLIFIFGFIYIGIRTILQPESANTKRFLAQLIIAALLINFSLFFAKLVIDVANTFTVEVYKLMTPITAGTEPNIGFEIVRQAGLPTFYNGLDAKELKELTESGSIGFYLMGFIFLMVTAFVLAAAAFMLIIRFVMLIFIMIFSPLMFALLVFPQTERYARDVFSRLLRYAFFAPIFLFLLYIAIRVLAPLGASLHVDSSSTATGLAKALKNTQGSTATSSTWAVFIQFSVAIMFMIAALKAAQQLSLAGGNQVVKFGNNLRGKAQSFLGRNTVGIISQGARELYEEGDARMTRTKKGRFARGLITAASLGTLSDRSVRGTLKAGEEAKFGGSYSRADDNKYAEELTKRRGDARTTLDREADIKRGVEAGHLADLNEKELAAFVKAIGKLTTDQLKDMDLNILTKENVAVHLSLGQIEELQKTGKYSADQIAEIEAARKNGMAAITEADGIGNLKVDQGEGKPSITMREALAKRAGKDTEAAKMPVEVFTSPQMAQYLTPRMVDAKIRDGINTDDRAKIKEILNDYLTNPNTSPDDIAQWDTGRRRYDSIARLGLDLPNT